MRQLPLHAIDVYKTDHRSQYPDGTGMVFSNWTPRASRLDGVDHVVFFGLQYYVKEYLQRNWNDGFFRRPKDVVIGEYKTPRRYRRGHLP